MQLLAGNKHGTTRRSLGRQWLKLYKPNAYWHVGTRLGYMPDAFQAICDPGEMQMRELVGTDLYGIGQEDTYHQKRDKRFRKTSRWLADPSTPLRQGTATTVAGPVEVPESDGSFHPASGFY